MSWLRACVPACLRTGVLSSGVLRAYVRGPCSCLPARKGLQRLGERGAGTDRRCGLRSLGVVSSPGCRRRPRRDTGRRRTLLPSGCSGVGTTRPPLARPVDPGDPRRAARKAPGLSPPRDGTPGLGARAGDPGRSFLSLRRHHHTPALLLRVWTGDVRLRLEGRVWRSTGTGEGAETRGTGFPLQATKQLSPTCSESSPKTPCDGRVIPVASLFRQACQLTVW
ncbi:protein EOLA2 isoform X2 [Equus przewalskii]|uniref:Protein EOLA2 isoform X2 n=1 Tax=Equus przewalskii TaxID=9798 RepID=A0ABM4N603_EQUPR